MKHLKYFLIALGLLVSSQAGAATCFWVGTGGAAGGGSYTSINAVNWASSSNGANSSCLAVGGVPKNAGDVATFDSAANGIGSNTVTSDGTVTGLATITIPTGTGTFNFGTGTAINLTTQFSMAAAGATVNCGTGTITFSGSNAVVWGVTAGTVLCGSGTIVIAAPGAATGQTFTGNGNTYGTLTINGRTTGSVVILNGANTFTNFNITPPLNFSFPGAATTTITNATSWTGTSSSQLEVSTSSSAGAIATISLGAASTAAWTAFRGLTFTTNSMTATNSFNLTQNTFSGGGGITAPSGGGGGIIGGGL